MKTNIVSLENAIRCQCLQTYPQPLLGGAYYLGTEMSSKISNTLMFLIREHARNKKTFDDFPVCSAIFTS